MPHVENMRACLTTGCRNTRKKISLVNLMTTFAGILTCAIFCILWGAAAASVAQQVFPHRGDWTVEGPIGSRAAGYLNSPLHSQLNETRQHP